MVLMEQLKNLKDQICLLKVTENKLDNIEHNISRIEETSVHVIPDIERKVKYYKEDFNQKIEIINYVTEYLEE